MNAAYSIALPENALPCALELSKNTWLLGVQFPDRWGGDTTGLLTVLATARNRWAKVSGKPVSIIICYEAGYDAFWLARLLKSSGIECLVVDAASLQVNRRGRRAKTDRIDVGVLLRTSSDGPKANNMFGRSCAFRVSRRRI